MSVKVTPKRSVTTAGGIALLIVIVFIAGLVHGNLAGDIVALAFLGVLGWLITRAVNYSRSRPRSYPPSSDPVIAMPPPPPCTYCGWSFIDHKEMDGRRLCPPIAFCHKCDEPYVKHTVMNGQQVCSVIATTDPDSVSEWAAPTGETRQRTKIPADITIAVAARDQGRCQQCGSMSDLQYDHVIPFSRNGADTVANLRLLCGTCNRAKGAR